MSDTYTTQEFRENVIRYLPEAMAFLAERCGVGMVDCPHTFDDMVEVSLDEWNTDEMIRAALEKFNEKRAHPVHRYGMKPRTMAAE